MKNKIILTDRVILNKNEIDQLRYLGDVDWVEEHELIEKVCDAKLIVSEFTNITKEVIESSPMLKGIITYGVGYDQIDVEEASKRGIYVSNLPIKESSESVATFVISAIINFLRHISRLDDFIRRGEWKNPETGNKPQYLIGKNLSGRTLGIIGFGKIGSRVAEIAKIFNMRIVAFDPYVNHEVTNKFGVELVSLPILLKSSDIVTLHLPITNKTKRLIGKNELNLMKPESYLINTARGGIVDQEALITALREHSIAGAALDVFPEEPISMDNPILQLDNVVLSPHIAGVSEDWIESASILIVEEAKRIFDGEPPKNIVNRSSLIQNEFLKES